MVLPEPLGLTFAEYLDLEARSDRRHEFVRGQVRLLTGGTLRHELLTARLTYLLTAGLDGGSCRVFPHNRKLLVTNGNVRYPDILVNCGKSAHEQYENDADYLVEVVSPSNGRQELAEKLAEYTWLPGAKQYLLLNPDAGEVRLYQRHDLGWSEREVAGRLRFADVDIDLDALYDHVNSMSG
jgi:Uma2 family endonuclease